MSGAGHGLDRVPGHSQRENSTYNGHFESACYHPLYHPLLWFDREGDCLTANLRPGNVGDYATGVLSEFLLCLAN